MGWDVVQNWMLTGHYAWRVPLRGVVHTWQHKGGKPPMDWWGIQYYSRYNPAAANNLLLYLWKKMDVHTALSSKKLLLPVAMWWHATHKLGGEIGNS